MLIRFFSSPTGKSLIGLLPFAGYLAHSFLTGFWIVDDAGITYAYAKNLSLGNGITAQPGISPVEGYSNPLWMLVLSAAHFFGLFHAVYTPKVLSAACFAGTIFFVRKSFLLRGMCEWNAAGILLLLAVNTPIVVWSNSGMENGLYLFLLSVLLYRFFSVPNVLLDVGISFLLMITRPEAALWGLLFPVFYLMNFRADGFIRRRVFCFFVSWLLCLTCITLFRIFYFQDVISNPFYAKFQDPDYRFSHVMEKARYLSFSLGGFWTFILIPCGMFFLFIYSELRKNRFTGMVFLCALFSAVLFMAMPDDWMRELRFATPFVFFFSLFFWEVFITLLGLRFSAISLCIFGLFLGYQAYHFYLRTHEFMKVPTVPLAHIKKEFADKYNRLAEISGLERTRVLIPDVGAMYYYGKLTVMDAAGLTDKEIAVRLDEGPALRQWILEEKQPEFIHLHGRWSLLYNLSEDYRFRERYIAIREYPDSLYHQGRMQYFLSGDYVHVSAGEKVGLKKIEAVMK